MQSMFFIFAPECSVTVSNYYSFQNNSQKYFKNSSYLQEFLQSIMATYFDVYDLLISKSPLRNLRCFGGLLTNKNHLQNHLKVILKEKIFNENFFFFKNFIARYHQN